LIRRAFNLALWRREKLRRRPTRSTQDCTQDEIMQISSLLWLRIGAPRHRDKSVGAINLFLFFLGHARFLFESRKFFLQPKNKIHFFLVDFETGF